MPAPVYIRWREREPSLRGGHHNFALFFMTGNKTWLYGGERVRRPHFKGETKTILLKVRLEKRRLFRICGLVDTFVLAPAAVVAIQQAFPLYFPSGKKEFLSGPLSCTSRGVTGNHYYSYSDKPGLQSSRTCFKAKPLCISFKVYCVHRWLSEKKVLFATNSWAKIIGMFT